MAFSSSPQITASISLLPPLTHKNWRFPVGVVSLREPDHREENCRLVDAPCCRPGGTFECAVRNCWEQWTRKVPTRGKPGLERTRKTTRRDDQRIYFFLLVGFLRVTRSTRRADVGVAIVPQTISDTLQKQNLKSNALSVALPLTPGQVFGNCVHTVVLSQINVECHRLAKGPFKWSPQGQFSSKRMLVRKARVAQKLPKSFSDFTMASPLPRFVPPEHGIAKNGRCHRVTKAMEI
ncbi:hypothetical protein TNCV_4854911 [Trichonephila clavipes]|nr:hypothetical protein TNCV_4854911 [Trichonephila clavipes]